MKATNKTNKLEIFAPSHSERKLSEEQKKAILADWKNDILRVITYSTNYELESY